MKSFGRVLRSFPGALLLLALAACPCPGATPVSYVGRLPDTDGITRNIRFTGQIDGSTLKGTVVVEDTSFAVTGTFKSDGSMDAAIALDSGESVGTVKVRVAPQSVTGGAAVQPGFDVQYDLGGRTGQMRVPLDGNISASGAVVGAP